MNKILSKTLILFLLSFPFFLNCTENRAPVIPGLDVLLTEHLDLIRGKRVGIITNATAITRHGTS
ncbi:MAG: DUF1343 domain-containing protein, partial [Calditrichaeota bacterium]|nr:DUF1343 domain-containing protein [Calditrichota bacterium]